MVFYLSIMLVFLFLALTKQNQSNRKLFIIIGTSILAFILGMKGANVGNDTGNYIYFFERAAESSGWYDPLYRFERGYQIYSKALSLIFNEYQVLFIFSGIICMGGVGYTIYKYSSNIAYSLFLLVGLRFYYFFLSGLRQSIAVSIVVFAFAMYRERKYIIFLILVLLATTFHNSAFVFLLMLPLINYKLSRKGIISVIIGIIGVYVLFQPLLSVVLGELPDYYSHYLDTSGFAAGNLANYLDVLMKISLLVLIYWSRYGRDNDCSYADDKLVPIEHTYVYFMIIATGISLIATQASMLDRLTQYFWIFSILAIPDIISKLRPENRSIIAIIVTLIVISYNLILLWLRPEWNMIVPYTFFWEE